jgi:cytochrome c oxidase assembly factor CtaG
VSRTQIETHKLRQSVSDNGGREAFPTAFAGLAGAVALLLPPVDSLADADLTIHMFQHIGIFACAIVFGYGLDKTIMNWAASIRGITRTGWEAFGAVMKFNSKTKGTVFVIGIPALVFIYWHFPQNFDLAVQNGTVHIFEHSTYLLAGSFVGMSFQAIPTKWRVVLLYVAFMHAGMMGSIWSIWRPPFFSIYSYPANVAMDTSLLVFGAIGVVLTSSWMLKVLDIV